MILLMCFSFRLNDRINELDHDDKAYKMILMVVLKNHIDRHAQLDKHPVPLLIMEPQIKIRMTVMMTSYLAKLQAKIDQNETRVALQCPLNSSIQHHLNT